MSSRTCMIHEGEDAVLATERVIAPILDRELGMRVRPADGLDTDRFGTLTREVERLDGRSMRRGPRSIQRSRGRDKRAWRSRAKAALVRIH